MATLEDQFKVAQADVQALSERPDNEVHRRRHLRKMPGNARMHSTGLRSFPHRASFLRNRRLPTRLPQGGRQRRRIGSVASSTFLPN